MLGHTFRAFEQRWISSNQKKKKNGKRKYPSCDQSSKTLFCKIPLYSTHIYSEVEMK
jgi:hypothetical protein